jgi:hypothetical protein
LTVATVAESAFAAASAFFWAKAGAELTETAKASRRA